MKVIDHLRASPGEVRFSFEIVPPPRGRCVQDILAVVDLLAPLRPPWIDVTSHASSVSWRENGDGTAVRKSFRKRPGSIGICGIIQNRYRIDTVAHILCQGFTREETEDALIELSFLGIENVLALRGDGLNFSKAHDKSRTVNSYAADLVEQVCAMRKAEYLHDAEDASPLDFCVGVAGYPEKHFEAANLKEDLVHLKKKVDAGADYIVTQMFFDNEPFYRFVESCRAVGIQVPIIPGLKMIRTPSQLKSIPKTFHVDLPEALVDEMQASPAQSKEIGSRWFERQVADLLDHGYFNQHVYVLNDAVLVESAIRKFYRPMPVKAVRS